MDIKPACDLVNFSHIHLDGSVILNTTDMIVGGAFPMYKQAHEHIRVV
jgi:hypothetical protein